MAKQRARGPLTFARQPRSRSPAEPAFAIAEAMPAKRSIQLLRVQTRKTLVHVANRPACFPAGAAWPIEMRAETLAAYLDFSSTRELCRAVAVGEAPAPHATRGSGKRLELIWYARAVDDFVARRSRLK